MNDKFGREIVIGSIIIYPGQYCDSAISKVGIVTKVREPNELTRNSYRTDRGTISIIGINDYSDRLEIQKKGALQHPNRVVVIDMKMVSNNYLDLLITAFEKDMNNGKRIC